MIGTRVVLVAAMLGGSAHAAVAQQALAFAETTDGRGYGDSGTMPDTPDHANYSKRAMALDQIVVM